MTTYPIYRQFANGQLQYWRYVKEEREDLGRAYAEDQVCRGYAHYVDWEGHP